MTDVVRDELPREDRRSLQAYLEQRPVLAQIVRAAGRKMRSFSRLSGEIQLKTPSEVAAVRGIGAELHKRDTRVRVEALHKAFLKTGFACSLRDAVDAISERPLVFREEEDRWRAAAAQWFANELAARCGGLGPIGAELLEQWTSASPQWTSVFVDAAMKASPDEEIIRGVPDPEYLNGSREFMDLWLAFRACVSARASAAPVLLPVLAERLTSDPHALDPDTAAGRTLLAVLQRTAATSGLEDDVGDDVRGTSEESAAREPRERPNLPSSSRALNADERAAVYASNNIAVDAISSTVAVWNVIGGGPVLAAARAEGTPIVLPLAALNRLEGDTSVSGTRNLVWVVENPAVFQAIIDATTHRAPDERPTLICGSGFLSLAVLRLIDRMVATGARVLYSGDWDTKGLAIAYAAIKRWPDAVRLWRMDPTRDPGAAPTPDVAPWRPDVGPARIDAAAWIMARRRPRYQEAWIGPLVADVQAAFDD